MPIHPPPLKLRSPKCQWHTIWQAASDALSASDLPPSQCPRCRHENLETRSASAAEAFLARLSALMSSKP